MAAPLPSSHRFLAVRSEENTGDDDLSMSGFQKGLCLGQGAGERLAANNRSGFGYNTIGAASVAAVLDLEKSPGLALE